MEFKKGDFVRIRGWEDIASEYGKSHDRLYSYVERPGRASSLSEMKDLYRREFIIEEIDNEIVSGIEEGHWTITTAMLKYVESEIKEDESLEEFIDGIYVKEET